MGIKKLSKSLLTDNPNAPEEDERTPIYWAAQNGHTEIVKGANILTIFVCPF